MMELAWRQAVARGDVWLQCVREARAFLSWGEGVAILRRMTDTATAPSFTVNGESRALAGAMTVGDLLVALGLDGRKVAVERNEAIVPRSVYGTTWLAAGDSLEIVHFIGGG